MTDSNPLEDNYFRLHRLIYNTAPGIFRHEFDRLWSQFSGKSWENGAHSGSRFISGPGLAQYQTSLKIQQQQLKSGNCLAWDLPILFESIASLNFSLGLATPQRDFDELKGIRNRLAHNGSTELESKKFSQDWNKGIQYIEKVRI